jgi:hypothetical protein
VKGENLSNQALGASGAPIRCGERERRSRSGCP